MKKFMLDAEIAPFDYDGYWGTYIGPKSVEKFVSSLQVGEEAEIVINSPGGSVIAGVAIANMIKNSPANIKAHVVGIAASMASVIACACREIVIDESAFVMMHNPLTNITGNAKDLLKEVETLELMKKSLMAFYRSKFDCDETEIARLMDEETWMNGLECARYGLRVTVNAGASAIAATISAGKAFAKMPEAAAKFCAFKEVPPNIRAALESGDVEDLVEPTAEPAAEPTAEPTAEPAAEPTAEPAAEPAAEPTAEPAAEPTAEPVAEPTAEPTASAENWQSRYKGASKKINELTAALKNQEAIVGKYNQFLSQLKNNGFEDLDGVFAKLSGLQSDLEKSNSDLAVERERAEKLVKTRDLLTGGVLTPAGTYEAKMQSAKTAKEREALRAQRAAGKI
jgi:ATP-dependent protease ClpP protease subunit